MNNAGYCVLGNFEELTPDDFQQQFATSIPIEVDLREQDALGVGEFDIRPIHSSVIPLPNARRRIPISDHGIVGELALTLLVVDWRRTPTSGCYGCHSKKLRASKAG